MNTIDENDNLNVTDNDTPVNINDDSEFPKAGLPVFRSLIPLTQLRQQLPISLILPKNYQMIPRENLATDNSPIDGLFGNAFNFIRRLKRDSEQVEKDNCSSINNDENCKPKTMKKIKIDLSSESAKKAFEDIFNINKVGHSHEETSSTELSCPISVFLKVMYEDISKQLTSDGSVIPKNVAAILNSISKGDNDSLRLVNKELSEVPFPTKVKVQLENGDEKNFLKELSDYVDTTLCSLTK
ncbi:hypothetical protein HF086_013408 [Spodoptera exigua]|uniref:Uncharacterized protein n=1 Tax=Spodoptera exigua TaxID=7107 RepID=A0A922M4T7_SPOEX|nr:hypothetical protein HF086_013408 [Spodoptera exigua]